MKKKIFILCLILLSPLICFSQEQTDYPKYILYIPKGIETTHDCPLVMALSPSADARGMINLWKPVADKLKWIIFASKESKNGLDMAQIMSDLSASLEQVFAQFPVDKSKIIVTGFSGGAMCSHAFIYTYPSKVCAIILNTGMMNEYYLDRLSSYPRNKIAVFLASPQDFRYNEMKRDKKLLDSLGWATKWIEFQGGHTLAPLATYLEAANWVNDYWQGLEKSKESEQTTSKESSTDKFKVDGIIFNPNGKSSVIINGEILQEGDRLQDLMVVKVHDGSVIVLIDGEKQVLKIQ